jgi:hypothetical protein
MANIKEYLREVGCEDGRQKWLSAWDVQITPSECEALISYTFFKNKTTTTIIIIIVQWVWER